MNRKEIERTLNPAELKFADSLALKHKRVRIYRSRGDILISREAMYTPGQREVFFIRSRNKPRAVLATQPRQDGLIEQVQCLGKNINVFVVLFGPGECCISAMGRKYEAKNLRQALRAFVAAAKKGSKK